MLTKCASTKCNELVDATIQTFCDKHGGVIAVGTIMPDLAKAINRDGKLYGYEKPKDGIRPYETPPDLAEGFMQKYKTAPNQNKKVGKRFFYDTNYDRLYYISLEDKIFRISKNGYTQKAEATLKYLTTSSNVIELVKG